MGDAEVSLPKPYYEEDGIVIYHGDCRYILPHLPKVDLVLTDPPYGINAVNRHQPGATQYAAIVGDDAIMDLRFIFAIGTAQVVFGANKFPDQLPHMGRWLVWDKRVDSRADAMLGSPIELAWTSRLSGFDWICRIQHGGVVNADRNESVQRFHPTQKPVGLMSWTISKYPDAPTILDPFMGSGTTLRAAKDLGRKAIGIEIEEKYCEIAVKRLAQEVLPL
jgi:site-specific DNA-methyltransferase (adenine-specific)